MGRLTSAGPWLSKNTFPSPESSFNASLTWIGFGRISGGPASETLLSICRWEQYRRRLNAAGILRSANLTHSSCVTRPWYYFVYISSDHHPIQAPDPGRPNPHPPPPPSGRPPRQETPPGRSGAALPPAHGGPGLAADRQGDEAPYLDPPAPISTVPKVPRRIEPGHRRAGGAFPGGRGGGHRLNLSAATQLIPTLSKEASDGGALRALRTSVSE